jgi:hypothetical protein
LEAWVKETRRLCADAGRAEIGDHRFGQILSTAPRSVGDAWPHEPVREIILTCRSRDLERGFEIGVYYRRGVTVRLPTDGGEKERILAPQYRARPIRIGNKSRNRNTAPPNAKLAQKFHENAGGGRS